MYISWSILIFFFSLYHIQAYNDYVGFVTMLSESVRGKKTTDETQVSEVRNLTNHLSMSLLIYTVMYIKNSTPVQRNIINNPIKTYNVLFSKITCKQ